MKQTRSSKNRFSLLDSAISRFSAEVFSHPAWVRFGKKRASVCLHLIGDLLSAAKNLEEDDPSTACQVLLICAVYQNQTGQRSNALKTTQRALTLAQHTGLFKEAIWAIWGACAISVQQGNYDQAITHLVDLQAALNEQNEWILADFVDVLKQSLINPVSIYAELPRDTSSRELLAFTFDWLQHWGFSIQSFEPEFEMTTGHPVQETMEHPAWIQPSSPVRHPQGRWHNLMVGIRGELRLQWTKSDSPIAGEKYSFWRAILNALRSYFSRRKTDTKAVPEISQNPSTSLLPAPTAGWPSKATTRRKKSGSPNTKANKKRQPGPGSNAVPVAVHMLGAFTVTIGDLTVKLPASRGLSLFKYILLHHKQKIPREVLMDTFWPDAEPETARNNLNVAMHSLRKALRGIVFLPVISFEAGAYGLESNLQLWLDVEEFERCVKAGQRLEARDQLTAAVAEYETAASLYQGDFLEQNPYDEWTVLDRERLRIAYLDTLDHLSQIYFNQERYAACITTCQRILSQDRCHEDAHSFLMRCYSRQGQHRLALRQYTICAEALEAELCVEPGLETRRLYEELLQRHPI